MNPLIISANKSSLENDSKKFCFVESFRELTPDDFIISSKIENEKYSLNSWWSGQSASVSRKITLKPELIEEIKMCGVESILNIFTHTSFNENRGEFEKDQTITKSERISYSGIARSNTSKREEKFNRVTKELTEKFKNQWDEFLKEHLDILNDSISRAVQANNERYLNANLNKVKADHYEIREKTLSELDVRAGTTDLRKEIHELSDKLKEKCDQIQQARCEVVRKDWDNTPLAASFPKEMVKKLMDSLKYWYRESL